MAMYNSFSELYDAYENKNRNEMGFEEELMFVDDCFDTYEAIGFLERFRNQYSETEKYDNQPFSVVGRITYSQDDVDLELLPMWRIRFENGEIIEAYPEEICRAEA